MKVLNLELDDWTKDEHGIWSQVCESHLSEVRNSNSVEEVERHVDEWIGGGICGVKGCDHEAEHHIDF